MTQPTYQEIHQFILDRFNESELNHFCFSYFLDAQNHFGSAMSKSDKVLELIGYCERRGLREDLLRALRQERERVFPHQWRRENSIIHKKTGLEFLRIPAGEFLYGENNTRIYLDEYWISKTQITFEAYRKFIETTDHPVPFYKEVSVKSYNWDALRRTYSEDKANHPVVLVSWYDAVRFCEWAGLQLPTEEQWEKAAKGLDGRIYPWGNDDPTNEFCNFGDVDATTPVGKYSPQGDSPYGCVDMAGNVWEWCLNKYDNPRDITIDSSESSRVLRGASWLADEYYIARADFRFGGHPGFRGDSDVGFRAVLEG